MNETLNKGSDNLTNQNRNTEKVANSRFLLFFFTGIISPLLFLFVATLFYGIEILIAAVFISFVVYWFLKLTDRYNVRPIREEEKAIFSDKKLVHYTDNLTLDDEDSYYLTGKIKLFGNGSPTSNYRLRYKDKCRNFVWFHLEDQPDEPYFRGFMETHGLEKCPRKYKIVTNFCDLQKANVYINPTNNYILVEGNVEVDGKLYTRFNWYDHKVYYLFMIKYSLVWAMVVWFDAIQKLVGSFLEKRIKTKDSES